MILVVIAILVFLIAHMMCYQNYAFLVQRNLEIFCNRTLCFSELMNRKYKGGNNRLNIEQKKH